VVCHDCTYIVITFSSAKGIAATILLPMWCMWYSKCKLYKRKKAC